MWSNSRTYGIILCVITGGELGELLPVHAVCTSRTVHVWMWEVLELCMYECERFYNCVCMNVRGYRTVYVWMWEVLELCMYECETGSRTVYVWMWEVLELCMYECERF